MKQILKVIVGSQAHGLATPQSDYDYRGVFVVPTEEFFKIGGKDIQHTSWIEGNEDDTSWEVGKFLMMATKCNPTVLETFLAPTNITLMGGDRVPYPPELERAYELGQELRALFPYVWNSTDVKNAFIGYGLNQRKKFFDNKDNRAPKYATAYLRVLYNAWELLSTGTFSVNMSNTPIFDTLKAYKSGNYTPGDVIDKCWYWETQVLDAYKKNPNKQTDLQPVNDFLVRLRKEMF